MSSTILSPSARVRAAIIDKPAWIHALLDACVWKLDGPPQPKDPGVHIIKPAQAAIQETEQFGALLAAMMEHAPDDLRIGVFVSGERHVQQLMKGVVAAISNDIMQSQCLGAISWSNLSLSRKLPLERNARDARKLFIYSLDDTRNLRGAAVDIAVVNHAEWKTSPGFYQIVVPLMAHDAVAVVVSEHAGSACFREPLMNMFPDVQSGVEVQPQEEEEKTEPRPT
jgi:hypothetical protein